MGYESELVDQLVNGTTSVGVIEMVVVADGGDPKIMWEYMNKCVTEGKYIAFEHQGYVFLKKPE